MRPLLALALVLAACGPADRSDSSAAHDAPSASPPRGSDPLVLRIARAGGRARVYAYANPDSVLWSAAGAPRIAEVLAFDPEQGVVSFVDTRNVPGRIDLRMGDISQAGARFTLANPATADGIALYGVSGGNAVRFTDAGQWELDQPRDIARVFPQVDGSLIAMARPRDGDAMLWRVHPPQTRVLDSIAVTGLSDGPYVQGGDQLYLATPTGMAVVATRTLAAAAPIALESPVLDAAATPSGDRLFIATDAASELAVYERYRGQLGPAVELPGRARAVRMDPLGRYLLVRPSVGDSAWVVAVGTRKRVGTVRTAWRTDLPFVGPDGAVGTAQGNDVVLVDGTTLRPVARIAGGAADYWYPFQWSGFRPRARGLDAPVEFDIGTSDSAADSTLAAAAAAADSVTRRDSTATPPPAPQRAPTQWLVSFAALLSEANANTLAQAITVDGQRARVVTSFRDDTPVYRVVLGPFAERAAAERAGRASGRPYWVYTATP